MSTLVELRVWCTHAAGCVVNDVKLTYTREIGRLLHCRTIPLGIERLRNCCDSDVIEISQWKCDGPSTYMSKNRSRGFQK